MSNWRQILRRSVTKNAVLAPYYNRIQWWLRGRSYGNREISPCYSAMYEDLACLCLKDDPHTILEFGCGDAYLLRAVCNKSPTSRLFGCDFSKTQINAAKHFLPTADFEHQDIRATTYKDKQFDVAIGVGVLMYLTPNHLLDALVELRRISSTVICVEMDCRYFNEKERASFMSASDGRFDHAYQQYFELAGFRYVECRRVDVFYDSRLSTGEMGYGMIVAR